MISMVQPLAVGNALRLWLQPPAGALLWRVLRKPDDTFTGEADPAAVPVYGDGSDKSLVDFQLLDNGTTYFYRAFYWDGAAWTPSATATGTPASTYADESVDALSIVRDRIAYGLKTEVARAALAPATGAIPVLNAPPLFETTPWPVVTVHLASESPAVRSLGEQMDPDALNSGEWDSVEGLLARVQLTIAAWSQNSDERIALRKSLRRLIVANLGVFDAAALTQIEYQFQDMDFVSGEYPATVYQAVCTFTCMAPARVITSRDPVVVDVAVTAQSTEA